MGFIKHQEAGCESSLLLFFVLCEERVLRLPIYHPVEFAQVVVAQVFPTAVGTLNALDGQCGLMFVEKYLDQNVTLAVHGLVENHLYVTSLGKDVIVLPV